MATIQLIPIQQPLEEAEVIGRLRSGWRIAGQVLVSRGKGVITPDNPQGTQIMPCNVWVLPEPMVPVSELFNALFSAANHFTESGPAMLALNYVSTMLFGESVEELIERTKPDEEPREQEGAGQDATRPVVPTPDGLQ